LNVVAGQSTISNNSKWIEERDIDKRPSLGLWYYDDMLGNKSTNWFVRHGNSEDGTHPYDDVEGNFTTTFTQEEVCANTIASGYGDTTPGGCEHDGKWRGKFYDNWVTTPFLEFTTEEIGDTFNYPSNYGPSTTSTTSQYYKHDVTTYSCSDSNCDDEESCTGSSDDDCGATWESETNSVEDPSVHITDFNGIFNNIIQVPTAGRYTFETYRDDGMTVEIDNIMVYDQWVYGPVTETFTAELTAGNHNIKVKVYTNRSIQETAGWSLKWYVEESDVEGEEELPKETEAGNHIPTTNIEEGILTYVRGAILGKGYVANAEYLEDFYPDADVRNPISLGSSNAVLYKYYDRDLQPDSYEETSAPLTAQVFFYLRSTRNPFGAPVSLFEPTVVLEDEMQKGNMYVGFLD